jgi:hypothetical protein
LSVPAPGLVEIARQADEDGLEVSITPDPDDSDSVVLTVRYNPDERDEAGELEDLAVKAWEEFND